MRINLSALLLSHLGLLLNWISQKNIVVYYYFVTNRLDPLTCSSLGMFLLFCQDEPFGGLNDYHRNNRVQARQKEDRTYTIKFKSCINKICGCHLFTNTFAISFQCNQYLVRVIQLVSMDSAAMVIWIFLKRWGNPTQAGAALVLHPPRLWLEGGSEPRPAIVQLPAVTHSCETGSLTSLRCISCALTF